MAEPVAESGDGLSHRVTRGLWWSILNTAVGRVGSLVAGMILARLLVPAEYGAYAVAVVVTTAMLSLNELGVSLAIVHWERDVHRIAPTVATLALATSAILYAACFAAAPAVARALNAPEAAPMIRLLATCVLLDAATVVPAQVIAREFQQRSRFVLDILGFVIGTGVSIALAVMGFGAWALIWGFLLTNVVSGIGAIVLAPWRTGFGFDPAVARELLGFGLPLAGASLVLFVMMNVDYVVVGRMLGPTALGLYLMAFNLCSWPVNLVSTTIRRVALAGFSRLSADPAAGSRAFLQALSFVLVVTVPMCTALAVFADDVLRVMYGAPWVPAAAALQPLVVLSLARIIVELVYDYLVALGRNRSNLVIHTIWLILLVPALILGAELSGIGGVGRAHALVAVVIVTLVTGLALRRAGLAPGALWTAARRPLLAAVPMALVGLLLASLLPGSALVTVLVGGGVSAAAYAALTWPILDRLRRRMTRVAAA